MYLFESYREILDDEIWIILLLIRVFLRLKVTTISLSFLLFLKYLDGIAIIERDNLAISFRI